jgi:hypothetical protein
MGLAALTEIFLEVGAKKVITADGPAYGITGEHVFKTSWSERRWKRQEAKYLIEMGQITFSSNRF